MRLNIQKGQWDIVYFPSDNYEFYHETEINKEEFDKIKHCFEEFKQIQVRLKELYDQVRPRSCGSSIIWI